MADTIINGANIPLQQQFTFVPSVEGALENYYQRMSFISIVKSVVNFQLVETPTTTNFWGVIFPMTDNQLKMMPEGQRTQWQYFKMFAQATVELKPDEVVSWLGIQYRVLDRKDFTVYSYMEYTLITDWTGSEP